MNKENCALKLVNEIILYYDARSKKHQILTSILTIFLFFRYCEPTPLAAFTQDRANLVQIFALQNGYKHVYRIRERGTKSGGSQ